MADFSIYTVTVPVFLRQLGNLSQILTKAENWAAERKISADTLLAYRLAPDMLPLLRQVQITTDHAKGAVARLSGREVPRFEDVEKTFAELQARLKRTQEFVQGFGAPDFQGAESRVIELKIGNEMVKFDAVSYLTNFAIPNFFFHYTTAYAILRHAGLNIGKKDFVGPR